MAARFKFLLPLLVLGGSLAVPARADGGGGGGGGAMPGADTPRYDPAVEYQNGVTAYQAKDYKAAVTAFKRVVSAAPKHAPAQYLLAASYLGQGDYKKAKKPLEAAVKADPALVEAQRDLGVTYAALGEAAKAAEQREVITQQKAACAATCPDAGRLDAAIAAIDAAIAGPPPQALGPGQLAPPASIDRSYVEAVSLINEGRYEAAIAGLEAALWRAGPHPDLVTYLGFANRKLRRYEAARGWYEMALAVAPEHRGALEYYGELKLELGDVAGARAHLARLDALCGFGCAQADELRGWIEGKGRSAS
ncbi:MAG: tetratricopeptide repeat protein [Novosphingobium sp.]